MSIEWECSCSPSSLGLRRSKGEERGCGMCHQMEVQQQTAESFSLQSPHHAVLVELVPIPAKRTYSLVSLRLLFEESLVTCSASMSMLGLLSLGLVMAVFLKSSTCCRLSERPGHIVLTFQLASHKNSFFFLCCKPGARFSLLVSFPLAPSIQ